MKKLLVASFIFLNTTVYAAIPVKIADDYKSTLARISNLKKNIQNIETELGKKNSEYLKVVSERQRIDIEIYELDLAISSNIKTLNSKKAQINIELKKILLSQMDSSDSIALIKKKFLKSRILENKKEINSQIENEQKLSKNLLNLKIKFQERVKIEQELYDVVVGLESDKTKFVQDYLDSKESAEVLKADLSLKSRKIEEREDKNSLAADFLQPLDRYISKEHESKGITYAVKDIVDVYASKSGEVIHTGTLANYGNVIMIDHGNDLRSIYLGDLTSPLKKGDRVEASSVIGKTRKSIRKEAIGKIYFEIRNKNKVQNTIKLVMNKRSQV